MSKSQPGSRGGSFPDTRRVIVQTYLLSTEDGAIESYDERRGSVVSGRRPLLDPRPAALFPAAGDPRLRRGHRARRVHAARPRRRAPMVFQAGLPRGTCALAVVTWSACSAAGQVPGVGPRRDSRSHPRSGSIHRSIVRDGARHLLALRALRRPSLDPGAVLWNRRGRHRGHRSQRVQAHPRHCRPRSSAHRAVCDQRRRYRLDREGNHLDLLRLRLRCAAGQSVPAIGVFLPPYLIVIFLAPHFRRWSKNAKVKTFVAGVTAAAAGAIAGAAYVLGKRAIVDLPTAIICLVVLLLLVKARKIPEPLLILGAGAAGLVLRHGAAP